MDNNRVEEAATTLDQLNKKYPIGSMDNYNRVTQQWKNAGWEIQSVYNLFEAEEISASKARELTRYIIDAAAASLPTNSMPEIREKYKQWCKETKRGGAVLIGGSINDFFDWMESAPQTVNTSTVTK